MAQFETEENTAPTNSKSTCSDLSDQLEDVSLYCQECDRTMLHKHEAYIHYMGKAHLKRVEMLKIQQQLKNEFNLTDEEMIYCAKCNKNLESPQVAKSHYESASHESNINMIDTSEIASGPYSSHVQEPNLEELREANLEELHQMQNLRPHNGLEGGSFENFDKMSGMLIAEVDDSDKNESKDSNTGESSGQQEKAQSSVSSKIPLSGAESQKTLAQVVPPFKRLKKDDVINNTTATSISSANQIKAPPPFKAIKAATPAAKPPFPNNQGSLIKPGPSTVKKTSVPPFKALKAANSVAKALKRIQGSGVTKTNLTPRVGPFGDAGLKIKNFRKGQLSNLERVKLRLGSGANNIPVGSERFAGDASNVLRLKEISAASGNPNRIPVGARLCIPAAGDPRHPPLLPPERRQLPATIRTSLGNESLLPVTSRPPIAADPYPLDEEVQLLSRHEWAVRERIQYERELDLLRHREYPGDLDVLRPRLPIPEREIPGSRGPIRPRDPYDESLARERTLQPPGYESRRDVDYEYEKRLAVLPPRDPLYDRTSLAPRELIPIELTQDHERVPIARKEEPIYPERIGGAREPLVYDYYSSAEAREREHIASMRWHDDFSRRRSPPPALERRELLPGEIPTPRPVEYARGYPHGEPAGSPHLRQPVDYPHGEARHLEAPNGRKATPPRPRYAAQELIRSRELLVRRPPPVEAKATTNVVKQPVPKPQQSGAKQPPFKKPAAAPPFKQSSPVASTSATPVLPHALKRAAPPPFKQPAAAKVAPPFKQPMSATFPIYPGRGAAASELVDPGRRILKRFSDDEMSPARGGGRDSKGNSAGPSSLVEANKPKAPFPPRQSNPPFANRLNSSTGGHTEELIRHRSAYS